MPISPNEFYGDKPKRREAWLKTLPQDVRNATDLTDHLKDALGDNKVSLAAELIATCLQNKVWEHIAEYDDDEPEIKSYHPMEWCREVLGTEPGELMKIVASPLPKPETGAAAAIELIDMVNQYEPLSFYTLATGVWKELVCGCERTNGSHWSAVRAHLDNSLPNGFSLKYAVDPQLINRLQSRHSELVSNKVNAREPIQKRLADEFNLSQSTVSSYLKMDPKEVASSWELAQHIKRDLGGNVKIAKGKVGSTNKDTIRRRLQRLSADEELAEKSGTTSSKCSDALSLLLQGKSAASCLKVAGLQKPKQPEVRLRVKQDKSLVAKRILDLLKPAETELLVKELIKALKQDYANSK